MKGRGWLSPMAKSSSPSTWSTSDLGTFFTENRSEFLSHARRISLSNSEAEEIVQDSLVRVLLACPELESVDHARAYFHRVIENLSIDLRRRQGRQPRLVVLDDATAEVELQWHEGLDHAEVLAAADDAAIVREALSLLSPAERAAIVMWEFEGRSTSEIADELGVRESAVKHTLSRARSSLRRVLAERVIDEERGLTALDLLSVSFRKMEKVAKKSSKAALSLLLILSVFLGFNSLAPRFFVSEPTARDSESVVAKDKSVNPDPKVVSPDSEPRELADQGSALLTDDSVKATSTMPAIRSLNLNFLGLDQDGIPTGFTVTDSTGSLGELFVGQAKTSLTESGVVISNIASTKSGAVNVLLDQSVILDSFGTSYVAEVSAGINGGWQPLVLSYVSSDVERLASGNYLLTAIMSVDSALETIVKVSTGISGTDLTSAPQSLLTRVLMDPSKTKILAQAVSVSADSQGNGA